MDSEVIAKYVANCNVKVRPCEYLDAGSVFTLTTSNLNIYGEYIDVLLEAGYLTEIESCDKSDAVLTAEVSSVVDAAPSGEPDSDAESVPSLVLRPDSVADKKSELRAKIAAKKGV